eukprot:SAG31_NODE_2302_length_5976_cov_5.112813_2_plen_137_part_00
MDPSFPLLNQRKVFWSFFFVQRKLNTCFVHLDTLPRILMFLEGVLTISNIRILGLHIESQLVKPNVAAMTEKEKLGKLSGGQEQANTISILRQRKEQLEEENARLVALLDERGYGELAVAAAPVTMAAFLASNSAQ